jgi:hypothetical protein
VPAGTDLVTFTYRPPHWLVASGLSVGSSLFLLVLAVVAWFRRGGRGSGRHRSRSRSRRGDHRRDEEGTAPHVPTTPPAAPPTRDPYVVSGQQ